MGINEMIDGGIGNRGAEASFFVLSTCQIGSKSCQFRSNFLEGDELFFIQSIFEEWNGIKS